MDVLHVVWTVGWDLFTGPAFTQAFQTATGCVSNLVSSIEAEIESLVSQAASDLINAAVYLAQAAALKIVKIFFQNLLPSGPQT
jgi:hypothetical protein